MSYEKVTAVLGFVLVAVGTLLLDIGRDRWRGLDVKRIRTYLGLRESEFSCDTESMCQE